VRVSSRRSVSASVMGRAGSSSECGQKSAGIRCFLVARVSEWLVSGRLGGPKTSRPPPQGLPQAQSAVKPTSCSKPFWGWKSVCLVDATSVEWATRVVVRTLYISLQIVNLKRGCAGAQG
jgi:hypothetical protein